MEREAVRVTRDRENGGMEEGDGRHGIKKGHGMGRNMGNSVGNREEWERASGHKDSSEEGGIKGAVQSAS